MKRNFSSSIPVVDHRLLIPFAALLGIALFLVVSVWTYRLGFPLDDAWIHHVYARNFALQGEWAFRPGEFSAGSTSPLWTALLSLGYILKLSPYLWTFFLGWVLLSLTAIRAESASRRILVSYRSMFPWVGMFFALSWHLTWSAVSGMETLLHGLIVLNVLVILMEHSRRYLALGLLAGLSVWVRPDGLTLLGPILLAAVLFENTLKARGKAIITVLIGFGILFVFYLLFNLTLSGTPLPSTFYAKQAEYGEYWLSRTLSDRLSDYLLPVIASPFVVLLPGLFLWVHTCIRERKWGTLAGLLWVIGYFGIYFMRLPAYQHGRYIIPAFPALYLWGMLGFVVYIMGQRSNRNIVFLWQSLLVVLVLVFQWLGARQNALDVAFIETQMVETAHWINDNLPADALLAVHDIGAIGYFTQNPLVDLAGLVTPEVIPFIRDETRLAHYLDSLGADYLVTFPGWYPQMVSGRSAIFIGGDDAFPFEDNMSIFRWR